MKTKITAAIGVLTISLIGLVVHRNHKPEIEAPRTSVLPKPTQELVAPKPAPAPSPSQEKSTEPSIAPPTVVAVITNTPPEPIIIKATEPRPPTEQEKRLARYERYYKQAANRYKNRMNQLAHETDTERRNQLIRQIAPFVRMDTLATLDWVMTLQTPEEQKAALEQINKHALVGIGAHIEKDETGLPFIRDTTLLSAAASTGQVGHGDYIAGVVREDGSRVDFKSMNMRQIVSQLRGQPGTDVRMVMMRETENGMEEYDVVVTRSMIIMEPPNK